ncbi:MAG: hypothetical protein FWG05_00190 [Kiritimatiellaeota bacterium]|nr:hypothetical protein [Kiritimatiellota bacterium]
MRLSKTLMLSAVAAASLFCKQARGLSVFFSSDETVTQTNECEYGIWVREPYEGFTWKENKFSYKVSFQGGLLYSHFKSEYKDGYVLKSAELIIKNESDETVLKVPLEISHEKSRLDDKIKERAHRVNFMCSSNLIENAFLEIFYDGGGESLTITIPLREYAENRMFSKAMTEIKNVFTAETEAYFKELLEKNTGFPSGKRDPFTDLQSAVEDLDWLRAESALETIKSYPGKDLSSVSNSVSYLQTRVDSQLEKMLASEVIGLRKIIENRKSYDGKTVDKYYSLLRAIQTPDYEHAASLLDELCDDPDLDFSNVSGSLAFIRRRLDKNK